MIQLEPISVPIELIIGAITIIGVPLSVWSYKVERRLIERKIATNLISKEILNQSKEIDGVKEKMSENHEEVINGLHKIELAMKDKKDRE
jgi:hypothetical protein